MARSGRKRIFTPEIRKTIVQAVRGGLSNTDACNMAGIGERTLYEWLAIGEAVIDGRTHRRMPKETEIRAAFAQFAQEYKAALAQGNLARVTQINRAAQDTWTHVKTGAIRFTAPPAVTWMNTQTGELVFDDPTGVLPGEWERQFSGTAWTHRRGEWQAAAWYLERTDPDNWSRRQVVRLEGGIEISIVNGAIEALKALGHDPLEFFVRLRERAGLPPIKQNGHG